MTAAQPGDEAPGGSTRQPDAGTAAQVQAEARQRFRQSLAGPAPLSGRQLGELFGRSERWGRDRIQETKAGAGGAAQVTDLPPPTPGAALPEPLPQPLPENGSAPAPVETAPGSAPPVLPHGDAAEATAEPAAERPAVPAPPRGNSGGSRAAVADRRAAAAWPRRWPLMLLAIPAGVATWSGWVGLGAYAGFGVVHPLPGIWDAATLNSAITLPVGVEAYAAYALHAWLTPAPVSRGTRKFARTSAIAALVLGMLGQIAFHLLLVDHTAKVATYARRHGQPAATAARQVPATAPWWITTLVACLPVLVLGLGAGLAHMLRRDQTAEMVPRIGPRADADTPT